MKKKAPKSKTSLPRPKALLLLLAVKSKTPKQQAAHEIELVPFDGFKNTVKKVLSTNKVESDRQLAEFQASNAKKREAKK